MHPLKLAAITAPLAALLVAAPASASAPVKPTCKASMAHPSPADYTTDDVRVSTSPGARVTTVAYYRTTTTVHEATADSTGHALVPYRISDATPGFQVRVGVLVVAGSATASCLARFTPRA
jgi:hypothetical protein